MTSTDPKETKVTIRIPSQLKEDLTIAAKKVNLNFSTFMLELLGNSLSNSENKSANSVGCSKNGTKLIENSSNNVSAAALKHAEVTLTSTAPKWNAMIDRIDQLNDNFDRIQLLSEDLLLQKSQFKSELKTFKNKLIQDSHDYRRQIDRFAMKHYFYTVCLLSITMIALHFGPKYFP